jgi:hypothetical protein
LFACIFFQHFELKIYSSFFFPLLIFLDPLNHRSQGGAWPMIRIKRCKCKNCHTLFYPDPRNAKRQNFCRSPECRIASKRQSQRKWLNKHQNRDYFKGPENILRVKQWRHQHPGYWRRRHSADKIALQDSLIVQAIENKKNTDKLPATALQDLLTVQPFVLLGLIAHFTGTALQDDIDTTVRRLQQLGRDIAAHQIHCDKGGYYGVENSYPAPSGAPRAGPVQLAGPPVGP